MLPAPLSLPDVPAAVPGTQRPLGQVVQLALRPNVGRSPVTGPARVMPLFPPRPTLPSPAEHPEGALCFTAQDRMALLAWHQDGGNGYARLVVEDGHPGAGPDRGAYALAYRRGEPFATLGLTRVTAGIHAWRCSHNDSLGLFPTMAAALAALPPG